MKFFYTRSEQGFRVAKKHNIPLYHHDNEEWGINRLSWVLMRIFQQGILFYITGLYDHKGTLRVLTTDYAAGDEEMMLSLISLYWLQYGETMEDIQLYTEDGVVVKREDGEAVYERKYSKEHQMECFMSGEDVKLLTNE